MVVKCQTYANPKNDRPAHKVPINDPIAEIVQKALDSMRQPSLVKAVTLRYVVEMTNDDSAKSMQVSRTSFIEMVDRVHFYLQGYFRAFKR